MKDLVKELLPDGIKEYIRKNIVRAKIAGKPKIFGIGNNKTGTTSLKTAMDELGFVIGYQREAEKMMEDWAKRDFNRIVEYCKFAQFFQDVPFSRPYTYVVLDHEFPGSKFILTVRDSPNQWYNSLTKYHARKYGKDGRIPTKEDLQQATYVEKGWKWRINRMSYKTPEDDPFNKEILLHYYNDYNKNVKEYFRHRPDDLLVLNVAEENAYQKLCDFLAIKPIGDSFPWKNKTKNIRNA